MPLSDEDRIRGIVRQELAEKERKAYELQRKAGLDWRIAQLVGVVTITVAWAYFAWIYGVPTRLLDQADMLMVATAIGLLTILAARVVISAIRAVTRR